MELRPAMKAVLLQGNSALVLAIASFLSSVVDHLAFFSVSKDINRASPQEKILRAAMLRDVFLSNLKRGLAPFGLPLEQFLAALRAGKASISGGFALQVVTGKSDEGGDIDIFAPCESPASAVSEVMIQLAALLRGVGYVLNNEPDEGPDSYRVDADRMPDGSVDSVVRTARSAALGRKVQLITLAAPNSQTGKAADMSLAKWLRKSGKSIPYMPRQLYHFDLTPCCVSLSVSPVKGKLLWNIPYLTDIAAGVTAPTPFLCNYDMTEDHKRNRTMLRVAKYSARGYHPTAELQRLLVGACPEDDASGMRAVLDSFCLKFDALKVAK